MLSSMVLVIDLIHHSLPRRSASVASRLFAPVKPNMSVASGSFAPVKTSIFSSVPVAPPASAPAYSSVALGASEPVLLYVFYHGIVSWSNESQFVWSCPGFRPFATSDAKCVCFSNNSVVDI